MGPGALGSPAGFLRLRGLFHTDIISRVLISPTSPGRRAEPSPAQRKRTSTGGSARPGFKKHSVLNRRLQHAPPARRGTKTPGPRKPRIHRLQRLESATEIPPPAFVAYHGHPGYCASSARPVVVNTRPLRHHRMPRPEAKDPLQVLSGAWFRSPGPTGRHGPVASPLRVQLGLTSLGFHSRAWRPNAGAPVGGLPGPIRMAARWDGILQAGGPVRVGRLRRWASTSTIGTGTLAGSHAGRRGHKSRPARTKRGRLLSYADTSDPTKPSVSARRGAGPRGSRNEKCRRASCGQYFLEKASAQVEVVEVMPPGNPGLNIKAVGHGWARGIHRSQGSGGAWTDEGVA
jgi:hypothetical protein